MLPLASQWKKKAAKTLYVPIDIECGGLQHSTSKDCPRIPEGMIGAQAYPILEITAKFYDGNYEEVAEPLTFVIKHDIDSLHARCSDWVINEFGDTLFHECHKSEFTLEYADQMITERIKSIEHNKAYILGNSVDLDRSFVHHQMPKLIEALHYRIIDVSTLKILFADMFDDFAVFNKQMTHRTELDITETMNELAYYRKHFIKSREQVIIDSLRPINKMVIK